MFCGHELIVAGNIGKISNETTITKDMKQFLGCPDGQFVETVFLSKYFLDTQ